MFANHQLITIDLWLLKFEVYWGWENGEGELGLSVLDFSMLKDFGAIGVFQFTAWVLSVSLMLELGGLTQRAGGLVVWFRQKAVSIKRIFYPIS